MYIIVLIDLIPNHRTNIFAVGTTWYWVSFFLFQIFDYLIQILQDFFYSFILAMSLMHSHEAFRCIDKVDQTSKVSYKGLQTAASAI